MREPIIERLSRFTPDGSGLDRDAILYAAGRASARPNRNWMALAGSLAACQLVTLVILWPRPTPAVDSHIVQSIAKEEVQPTPTEVITPSSPTLADAAELWNRNRRMLMTSDTELPPPVSIAGPMVPSDPPLHAYSTAAYVGLD